MTACNYLSIILIVIVAGCGAQAYAEDDVTVVSPPPAANASPVATTAPDGSPVIHKSSHKKKKKTSDAVAGASSSTSASGTASSAPVGSSSVTNPPSPGKPTTATASATSAIPSHNPTPSAQLPVAPKPVATTTSTVASVDQSDTAPVPTPSTLIPTTPAAEVTSSLGPAVETGLPIARHSPTDSPDYSAPSASYRTTIASSLTPLPLQTVPAVLPPSSSYPSAGSYPSASGSPNVDTSYVPSAEEKRTRTYPWKRDIITTEFWIGEAGSSISPTDNIGSAWDENWRSSNHGSDSPTDRQGYLPAGHAPTVNPFYIALPFNDLAYPDQARRWLPSGWERKPRDGKQVSACKDRWVEIKNEQGDVCYAQWEDVGPLTSDHPEYVFGNERPDTYTRAGLDVSPAVAKYLGIEPEGKNRLTAWRFVDAEDVPPGYWLKYDEEALIYAAMHDLNNKQPTDTDDDSSIQRSIAPIDDPSQINTNKKKVGAAKG